MPKTSKRLFHRDLLRESVREFFYLFPNSWVFKKKPPCRCVCKAHGCRCEAKPERTWFGNLLHRVFFWLFPMRIGKFEKFVFPIIRKTWASQIANDLVSVQPMTGPIGGIAFYRPRYQEKPNDP